MADTSTPRVREFLEYLRSECGLAENTILAYRRDLADFTRFLQSAELAMADLRPADLQRFLIGLQGRGLSSRSISRTLVAVRMFARFLRLTGRLDRDVTAAVETPRTWHRLPKVLGRRKVEELLAAPDPQDRFYLRDKGILELADSYRNLRGEFPQLRLVLVGPVEDYNAVPKGARDSLFSDPQVIQTGFLQDTTAVYPLADVVVLPTHREGFPNVPLEAAAMEVPVVGTSAVGCVDAIRHGLTGSVVLPGDAGALARARPPISVL